MRAGAGTLDADVVVPCFQMRRYDDIGVYVIGHRIFPRSGGTVDNYPTYAGSGRREPAPVQMYASISSAHRFPA